MRWVLLVNQLWQWTRRSVPLEPAVDRLDGGQCDLCCSKPVSFPEARTASAYSGPRPRELPVSWHSFRRYGKYFRRSLVAFAVGAEIFQVKARPGALDPFLCPFSWVHLECEWCAGLNPPTPTPEQLPEALRLRITYCNDPCGWPHASDTSEFCEHNSALCVRLPPPGVASPHTPCLVVPGQWSGLFPLSHQDPSSSEGCSVMTTFTSKEGLQKGLVWGSCEFLLIQLLVCTRHKATNMYPYNLILKTSQKR